MEAHQQLREIRPAMRSNQGELVTLADAAISPQWSGDGYQSRAAVLGQAHWMAVGKLTPGLIHEINNALCVIGNYIQILMLEHQHRGSEALKPLITMSATIERVQALTHRVAAYARENAHPSASIRVNELLEKALTLANLQKRFREIQLHKSFGTDLPEVKGDPRSLMDAFVELLTIDGPAVAQGGAVAILTRSTPGWVTVSLSGVDCVWPCSEASVTLARQIVEQQGGRLVREEDPGRGAGNISVWLRTTADAVAAQAT